MPRAVCREGLQVERRPDCTGLPSHANAGTLEKVPAFFLFCALHTDKHGPVRRSPGHGRSEDACALWGTPPAESPLPKPGTCRSPCNAPGKAEPPRRAFSVLSACLARPEDDAQSAPFSVLPRALAPRIVASAYIKREKNVLPRALARGERLRAPARPRAPVPSRAPPCPEPSCAPHALLFLCSGRPTCAPPFCAPHSGHRPKAGDSPRSALLSRPSSRGGQGTLPPWQGRKGPVSPSPGGKGLHRLALLVPGFSALCHARQASPLCRGIPHVSACSPRRAWFFMLSFPLLFRCTLCTPRALARGERPCTPTPRPLSARSCTPCPASSSCTPAPAPCLARALLLSPTLSPAPLPSPAPLLFPPAPGQAPSLPHAPALRFPPAPHPRLALPSPPPCLLPLPPCTPLCPHDRPPCPVIRMKGRAPATGGKTGLFPEGCLRQGRPFPARLFGALFSPATPFPGQES